MTNQDSQPPAGIDPRGPRFAASVSAVVLLVVVLTASPWVLGLQWVVFAIGAFAGVSRAPYGQLFRLLVRPRLSPPAELEDPRPPRFSQLVGFIVVTPGVLLGLSGSSAAVLVSASLALIAAGLNSVFGYCLGCELYLLLARFRAARAA
jgi:hypothetical protein